MNRVFTVMTIPHHGDMKYCSCEPQGSDFLAGMADAGGERAGALDMYL